jgi:hypothetical protein
MGLKLEADMFAECVRKCLRIAEIPITYRAQEDQPTAFFTRDGSNRFFCASDVCDRHKGTAAASGKKTERLDQW